MVWYGLFQQELKEEGGISEIFKSRSLFTLKNVRENKLPFLEIQRNCVTRLGSSKVKTKTHKFHMIFLDYSWKFNICSTLFFNTPGNSVLHLQTLQSEKTGNFSKELKKPGDSVKNLQISKGYFFCSNNLKCTLNKAFLP